MAGQRYTPKEKHTILQDVNKRIANGETLKSIALRHRIDRQTIRAWKAAAEAAGGQNLPNIEEECRRRFSTTKTTNTKKKNILRPGPKSRLHHIEEELVQWIIATIQNQGIRVRLDYDDISSKAGQMDEDFSQLSRMARHGIIHRLCVRNSITLPPTTATTTGTTSTTTNGRKHTNNSTDQTKKDRRQEDSVRNVVVVETEMMSEYLRL